MIRFGPAGIPLSCKGRTIRDGIEDVHALGLHCMEIQLVRGKYVDELDDFEELGGIAQSLDCLLYTSPSPRDGLLSRMPSSA